MSVLMRKVHRSIMLGRALVYAEFDNLEEALNEANSFAEKFPRKDYETHILVYQLANSTNWASSCSRAAL